MAKRKTQRRRNTADKRMVCRVNLGALNADHAPRLVRLIRGDMNVLGKGTEGDPVRRAVELWTMGGVRVIQIDPLAPAVNDEPAAESPGVADADRLHDRLQATQTALGRLVQAQKAERVVEFTDPVVTAALECMAENVTLFPSVGILGNLTNDVFVVKEAHP
jgi:hypothetical protein